jgi:hypothetical protein
VCVTIPLLCTLRGGSERSILFPLDPESILEQLNLRLHLLLNRQRVLQIRTQRSDLRSVCSMRRSDRCTLELECVYIEYE